MLIQPNHTLVPFAVSSELDMYGVEHVHISGAVYVEPAAAIVPPAERSTITFK